MLTDNQHQNRTNGIGATDSSCVLGVNPYKTAYELWMEKTGKMDDVEKDVSPHLTMGLLMEEPISKRYSEITGDKLRKSNLTWRHDQHHHLLCHPDRIVVGNKKLVEIKTTNYYRKDWGEEGTDQVPYEYIIQVQHQMMVMGYRMCDLVVYPKGAFDIKIYPIDYDPTIAQIIMDKCNDFWVNHVKTNVAPPLQTRSDAFLAYPEQKEEMIQATDEMVFEINLLKNIKKKLKLLTQEKCSIENKLAVFMKDYGGIVHQDETLVTYRKNKNGTKVLRIP